MSQQSGVGNLELMSEAALIEILKSHCIQLPDVKSFTRADLMEMAKRVAVPLPQRRYDESKFLGKKLSELRQKKNISTDSQEINSSPKPFLKRKAQAVNGQTGQNGLKRKINEQENLMEVKRQRHKITWP